MAPAGTRLYVGNLSPSVDESVVRPCPLLSELLQSWTRVT